MPPRPSPKPTTSSDIHPAVLEAEIAAKRQRLAGLELLRVDESKANPEELSIYGKMKGCKDAEELDKFLRHHRIVDLFFRGVLFFSVQP